MNYNNNTIMLVLQEVYPDILWNVHILLPCERHINRIVFKLQVKPIKNCILFYIWIIIG